MVLTTVRVSLLRVDGKGYLAPTAHHLGMSQGGIPASGSEVVGIQYYATELRVSSTSIGV